MLETPTREDSLENSDLTCDSKSSPISPDLPIPVGTRILVRMWKQPEKMKGGSLYIPETRISDENDASIKAQVLALGADAYTESAMRGYSQPFCKVGDWVLLSSYAGNRFEVNGDDNHYRIVQDTAVIARITDPDVVGRFSHA